jgi:putative ABC transport system ATP-binding protein
VTKSGRMRNKMFPRKDKTPLIQLSDVTKVYRNAAGSFSALKNINVNFYDGEFVGVIGKSGSGKSTLVNMITGIDRPSHGVVLVAGEDIHAMKESEQAHWRGLNMGVVFQFFQLLPMLTVLENVLLPMDFCDKYDPAERPIRAMHLLEMMGLEDNANKLPGSLSGGQQQSAAIARALANDPSIIVADEPTGNLDAKTADSVYDKLESLAGEGRTIIMITHDPEIEKRLSRTVLLSDGEVIDPILVYAFPWLPHPILKVLGQELGRHTLTKGEVIDLSGRFVNQIIMIEQGEICLTYSRKPNKGKEVFLGAGAFFGGQAALKGEKIRHFSAKSMSKSTSVAILPWERLLEVVGEDEDVRRELQRALKAQMLDKNGKETREKGVIR